MPSPDPASGLFALTRRVVLVTGAGRGVGRAIALGLAHHGAAVVVNDIAGVDETVALIGAAGGRAVAAVADVAEVEAPQACVAAAEAAFGRLDVVVNNAAVISEVAAFVDLSPRSIERDIRVGLIGTMNVARAALPGMIARRFGRIINIASDAGRAGNARLASYSATKGGVIAFTKALAQEVGPLGITVNAVAPGSVRAPMRDQILSDINARLGADAVAAREQVRLEQYPTRRIAEPEDIANAVLFFASDYSANVTGQTLSVNGGFRMY